MTRSTSSRPFTGSRLSAGTLALAALAAGVPKDSPVNGTSATVFRLMSDS
jgi:hypothetical protein